jgi:hypothetical protein
MADQTVTFEMEHRREGRTGVKPVAVFQFLSEDWSPWIALVRERWPGLRFTLRREYLQSDRPRGVGKANPGGFADASVSGVRAGLLSAARAPS